MHYQLLLHRWDVVRAAVDKCGVVLAEEHRVEHLFTWKKIKEICVRHLNMAAVCVRLACVWCICFSFFCPMQICILLGIFHGFVSWFIVGTGWTVVRVLLECCRVRVLIECW